jgi:hypothetical protein
MAWQPLLAVPGPLLSSPHISWPTSNGGEPITTDVASSRSAAGSAPAAARTRGQPSGATLPTTDARHGSWQSEATMDGARGALVSIVADLRLRGAKAS